ncbi:MAG TPA: transketolase C-terminal domain-containing protein, partial [Methyloceanibacter sp.]|nr:transketolase C-terminal domain-containing protein [Methyloceanibacter sp.]
IRAELTDPIDEKVGAAIVATLAAVKADFTREGAKLATRQSSQKVLEKLMPVVPGLIGGSADLTGSVGTLTKQHGIVKPGDFAGNYIHYGVREHAMAAAMNGMALHGGIVPYGGTFLVFSDYCRPSIRLSALMQQRVIYIMTHDSIGLGEDGPTHQPVEHLAALRAIPNLNVMRPADAVECAECWELALLSAKTPSVLALTRQGVPLLRTVHTEENLSAKGAYVLNEPKGGRDVTLIGTGSELALAVQAAKALEGEGLRAAVVSMPCFELFAAQSESYRNAVLGSAPRVGVEAAIEFGWENWLGPDGAFVGMRGFGASAPAQALYKHFGITAEAVAAAARELIGKTKR